jgi:hypothetical protein
MVRFTTRKAPRVFGDVALAAILLLAALVPVLSAKETFKARMLTGRTGFSPPQINIIIDIEGWTTPEEFQGLAEAMNRGGFNAFQDAFNNLNKGSVRFMSDRGHNLPVHASHVVTTEKGRTIVLFLNHQAWEAGSTFVEHSSNPFMVIEIKLDEKGKGDGRFYEFAQIRLRPELGTMEMESFAAAPKLFPIVQDVTKKKPPEV